MLTSYACSYSSAQEIRELWMEYENNASLEAKVVKDFDKVQFIHQVTDIRTTSVGSYHMVVLAIFQRNGMA